MSIVTQSLFGCHYQHIAIDFGVGRIRLGLDDKRATEFSVDVNHAPAATLHPLAVLTWNEASGNVSLPPPNGALLATAAGLPSGSASCQACGQMALRQKPNNHQPVAPTTVRQRVVMACRILHENVRRRMPDGLSR